jgi:hypothetical protein
MASPFVAGKNGLLTPSVGGFPNAGIGPIGRPAAPAPSFDGLITVAQRGAITSQNGYGNGGQFIGGIFGSINPAPYSVNGAELVTFAFRSDTNQLYVTLIGTLAQSFWTTVHWENGAGSFSGNSADAAFGTGSGQSNWVMSVSVNSLWTTSDIGEIYGIAFVI